jgi:hypothetical protein
MKEKEEYISTVRVVEDENGELIIPLDDKLLNTVGWNIGDTIAFEQKPDGSFLLKKDESEFYSWVLVETVAQYRMRYCVRTPVGKEEWALDEVCFVDQENGPKEFSQKFLGETIISQRVISEKEALDLCKQDNEGVADNWTDDLIKKNYFLS